MKYNVTINLPITDFFDIEASSPTQAIVKVFDQIIEGEIEIRFKVVKSEDEEDY